MITQKQVYGTIAFMKIKPSSKPHFFVSGIYVYFQGYVLNY